MFKLLFFCLKLLESRGRFCLLGHTQRATYNNVMINLKNLFFIVLCTAFSWEALCACPKFHRIYGSVDLATKKWSTTKVSSDAETFCEKIPSSPNGNLELTIQKKSQKFSQKIFRPLERHWDEAKGDGSFTGGKTKLSTIELTTLVPDWYKGATLIIKDIGTGKKITETKL